MHTLKSVFIVLCAIALTAGGWSPGGGRHRDLGTEVLGANDVWAALDDGTTGGSAAAPDHVYTVTNRQELVAALNDGIYPPPSSAPSAEPKIIYVDGSIDVNVDDESQPLTCQDYYRNGYTLEDFLATYCAAKRRSCWESGPYCWTGLACAW